MKVGRVAVEVVRAIRQGQRGQVLPLRRQLTRAGRSARNERRVGVLHDAALLVVEADDQDVQDRIARIR